MARYKKWNSKTMKMEWVEDAPTSSNYYIQSKDGSVGTVSSFNKSYKKWDKQSQKMVWADDEGNVQITEKQYNDIINRQKQLEAQQKKQSEKKSDKFINKNARTDQGWFMNFLGTTGDILSDVGRGIWGTGETLLLDLPTTVVSYGFDLFGDDETGKKMRKFARKELAADAFKFNDPILEEYSYSGKYTDFALQTIAEFTTTGTIGSSFAKQATAKATQALNTAKLTNNSVKIAIATKNLENAGKIVKWVPLFTKAATQATLEADGEGANAIQALSYGVLSGATEVLTEQMFSFMGGKIGSKLGIGGLKGITESTPLDELLVGSLTKGMKNGFLKTAVQTTAMSLGEGFEEFVSGIASAFYKYTLSLGGNTEWQKDIGIMDQLKTQKLGESFFMGAFTAALAGAPANLYQYSKTGVTPVSNLTQEEMMLAEKTIEEQVSELEYHDEITEKGAKEFKKEKRAEYGEYIKAKRQIMKNVYSEMEKQASEYDVGQWDVVQKNINNEIEKVASIVSNKNATIEEIKAELEIVHALLYNKQDGNTFFGTDASRTTNYLKSARTLYDSCCVPLQDKLQRMVKKMSKQEVVEKIETITKENQELKTEPVDNLEVVSANQDIVDELISVADEGKEIKAQENTQNVNVRAQENFLLAEKYIEAINKELESEGLEDRIELSDVSQKRLNQSERQMVEFAKAFGIQIVYIDSPNINLKGAVLPRKKKTDPYVMFYNRSKSVSNSMVEHSVKKDGQPVYKLNANEQMLYTLGHEIYHVMVNEHKTLAAAILKYTKDTVTDAEIATYVKRKYPTNKSQTEMLKPQNRVVVIEEIAADNFAKIIMNRDFFVKLKTLKPELSEQIEHLVNNVLRDSSEMSVASPMTSEDVKICQEIFDDIINEAEEDARKLREETERLKKEQEELEEKAKAEIRRKETEEEERKKKEQQKEELSKKNKEALERLKKEKLTKNKEEVTEEVKEEVKEENKTTKKSPKKEVKDFVTTEIIDGKEYKSYSQRRTDDTVAQGKLFEGETNDALNLYITMGEQQRRTVLFRKLVNLMQQTLTTSDQNLILYRGSREGEVFDDKFVRSSTLDFEVANGYGTRENGVVYTIYLEAGTPFTSTVNAKDPRDTEKGRYWRDARELVLYPELYNIRQEGTNIYLSPKSDVETKSILKENAKNTDLSRADIYELKGLNRKDGLRVTKEFIAEENRKYNEEMKKIKQPKPKKTRQLTEKEMSQEAETTVEQITTQQEEQNKVMDIQDEITTVGRKTSDKLAKYAAKGTTDENLTKAFNKMLAQMEEDGCTEADKRLLYEVYKDEGGVEVIPELETVVKKEKGRVKLATGIRESQSVKTLLSAPTFTRIFNKLSDEEYTNIINKFETTTQIKTTKEMVDKAKDLLQNRIDEFATITREAAKTDSITMYTPEAVIACEIVLQDAIERNHHNDVEILSKAYANSVSDAARMLNLQKELAKTNNPDLVMSVKQIELFKTSKEYLKKNPNDTIFEKWFTEKFNKDTGEMNISDSDKGIIRILINANNEFQENEQFTDEEKRIQQLITNHMVDQILYHDATKSPKFSKQLTDFRRLAMLSRVSTQARNVFSNIIMNQYYKLCQSKAIGKLSDSFAMSYINKYATKDLQEKIKKIEGSVHQYESLTREEKKFVKDLGREKSKVANHINKTLGINIYDTSTEMRENKFTSEFLNKMSDKLNYVMEAADTFAFTQYLTSETYRLQKAIAREKGVPLTKENISQIKLTPQQANRVLNVAQELTFKNKSSAVYKFTKSAIDFVNTLSNMVVPNSNLGNMLQPFALTPANVGQIFIESTPIGYAMTMKQAHEFKKMLQNKDKYSTAEIATKQQELARTFGRNVAGLIVSSMGYLLYELGVITGAEPDDKEEKELLEAQGWQPYSIKIGDYYMSYDWASPAGTIVALGANVAGSKTEDTEWYELFTSILEVTGEQFKEQTVLETFAPLFNESYGDDTLLKRLANVASSIPSSYIPGFIQDITNTIDPTVRQTYDENFLKSTYNQFISRIPFAKSTLVGKTDRMGNEQTKSVFNVWLPAKISYNTNNDLADELISLSIKTGNNNLLPSSIEKTLTYKVDGVSKKVTFTKEQQLQLTEEAGVLFTETFNDILTSDLYINASDDEKIEIIDLIREYAKGKVVTDSGFAEGYISGANGYTKLDKYLNYGLTIENALLYGTQILDIEGDKDEQGETITGSQSAKRAYAIMNYTTDNYQKNLMLELLQEQATKKGTQETVTELSKLTSLQDYKDYFSLTKSDLFLMKNYSREDYQTAQKIGISGDDFMNFYNYVDNVKSDVDITGKEISGSKKRKVIQYLNSTNLNLAQKAYLLSQQGYSVKEYRNVMSQYLNQMSELTYDEKLALYEQMFPISTK